MVNATMIQPRARNGTAEGRAPVTSLRSQAIRAYAGLTRRLGYGHLQEREHRMSDGEEHGQAGGGQTRDQTKAPGFSFRRLLPLLVLVAGLLAFFAFDLDRYVSFDALRMHRGELLAFVAEHRIWAGLAFMAIYVAAVALSLPGGTVLSLIGGFLFGAVASTGLVVVSATLGATILFVVAKSALGDPLRAKAGPWMERLAEGFQKNELSYLLFLRLVPLFPFFVVNLVMGLTGARWVRTPGTGIVAHYYQQLTRTSASLALVADMVMLTLGRRLKRLERLSARLGDVLSHLYLASAALKRFEAVIGCLWRPAAASLIRRFEQI